MEIGYRYSLLLHLILIILISINFPPLSSKRIFKDEEIITIESFIISEKTNIPQAKKENKEKNSNEGKTKKVSKKTIVAPQIKEKADPPLEKPKEEPSLEKTVLSKKLEKTAEIIKSEIKEQKQAEQKETKVKPQIKQKIDEKPKEEEKDFDSLLKDLEAENASPSDDGKNKKGANIEKYDPSLPLSLSEKDAIKSQIMSNWSIPAGGRGLKKMYVILKAEVEEDGTIKNIEIKERNMYHSGDNKFYQIFIDSAVRAMQKSSPLQGLSIEKYNSWRDLEIYFDPRELVD